jgi:hypothetical protein
MCINYRWKTIETECRFRVQTEYRSTEQLSYTEATRTLCMLSVWLSDCLTVWILTVSLSDCLTVWLSDCLTVWLSGCLTVWLSDCLTVWMSDCLYVICLSVYLSISLTFWNRTYRLCIHIRHTSKCNAYIRSTYIYMSNSFLFRPLRQSPHCIWQDAYVNKYCIYNFCI